MGLQEGVDLGLMTLEEPLTGDDPNDPRRGSDRVDQFLMSTLCRLGEDEFPCLIRSHKFGFRPSEGVSS
jgi:hypothetical protein